MSEQEAKLIELSASCSTAISMLNTKMQEGGVTDSDLDAFTNEIQRVLNYAEGLVIDSDLLEAITKDTHKFVPTLRTAAKLAKKHGRKELFDQEHVFRASWGGQMKRVRDEKKLRDEEAQRQEDLRAAAAVRKAKRRPRRAAVEEDDDVDMGESDGVSDIELDQYGQPVDRPEGEGKGKTGETVVLEARQHKTDEVGVQYRLRDGERISNHFTAELALRLMTRQTPDEEVDGVQYMNVPELDCGCMTALSDVTDPTRIKVRGAIQDAAEAIVKAEGRADLGEMRVQRVLHPRDVAALLEGAIHEAVHTSYANPHHEYVEKSMSILACLLNPETRLQRRGLMMGEARLLPSVIANMSPEELASPATMQKREDSRQYHQLLANTTEQMEAVVSAATDEFKCRKCKSRCCTYMQKQTRSADEPMTTFIRCLDCNFQWREG